MSELRISPLRRCIRLLHILSPRNWGEDNKLALAFAPTFEQWLKDAEDELNVLERDAECRTVLAEFVRDVEAVYVSSDPELFLSLVDLEDEWYDLSVTYGKARALLDSIEPKIPGEEQRDV